MVFYNFSGSVVALSFAKLSGSVDSLLRCLDLELLLHCLDLVLLLRCPDLVFSLRVSVVLAVGRREDEGRFSFS